MIDSEAQRRAHAVRHFNRFYARYVGALHQFLQQSPFSLTEARVLHELSKSQALTAAALTRHLGLDSGYLSRLLTSFERRDLISRQPSDTDARQSFLVLTEQGHAAYKPLDSAALEEVHALLADLKPLSQERLISAMQVIERLLDERLRRAAITLRQPRAGECSWLVHRQAQWFASELGWDRSFEGLLARIVADYLQNDDPLREMCWVAEQEDVVVGSVCLVGVSTTVAGVRLLWVEPEVQRIGLGMQLMNECVRFAKRAGYTKLTLTTTSALTEIQRLCERTGFTMTGTKAVRRFGKDLDVERWDLEL